MSNNSQIIHERSDKPNYEHPSRNLFYKVFFIEYLNVNVYSKKNLLVVKMHVRVGSRKLEKQT